MMQNDKNFEKIKSLPWKACAWVVGSSFICATVLSMSAAWLFFPDSKGRGRSAASNFTLQENEQSLKRDDVSTIMQRNLFQAEGLEGFDEGKGSNEPVAEVIKSSLPLQLMGTIFSGDPENGIAIVKFKNKNKTGSFMNGDLVVGRAMLKEVHREKIVLDNGGQLEYIEIDKKELVRTRRKVSKSSAKRRYAAIATAPAAKEFREEGFERSGGTISMSKDYKARLLGPEFTKVLQDAKASPNIVGGKLRGFQLSRIRENSIYQKSGLQNGDVVEEINGVLLTDTAQAIKLLNSLRNEAEIEMRVVRGGKPINFVINVQ